MVHSPSIYSHCSPSQAGGCGEKHIKACRQQYNLPYFALFSPKEQINDDVTIMQQNTQGRWQDLEDRGRLEEMEKR